MTHEEKALNYFSQKFHCSQSVLAAFADECGLTEEQALKMGSCFGSGMRQGQVCGACTGGLMVLGMLFGEYDKNEEGARERANRVNDKMMTRFADACGSYICNELLGCDVRTPEGLQHCLDNNLFTEFCPVMVKRAVAIVENIIDEELK